MTALIFFFSSVGALPNSSPLSSALPSAPSSPLSSSSSLSGAPKAFAGLALSMLGAVLGAAKLESLGPAPPANPFPNAEPKTLPVANDPKPDVPVAPPNPKPDAGLS